MISDDQMGMCWKLHLSIVNKVCVHKANPQKFYEFDCSNHQNTIESS